MVWLALNVDQFGEEHLKSLVALTGEPLVTDDEVLSARACLAVAWENVKEAGSSAWVLGSAPSLALTILISAAARAWMNLGGFVDERADAVNLSRSSSFAAGAELTALERGKLERLSGRDKNVGVLKSVPVSATTISNSGYGSGSDWWRRNIMVYRPGMSPEAALPIPYLPGDDRRASSAGDLFAYEPGYYSDSRFLRFGRGDW